MAQKAPLMTRAATIQSEAYYILIPQKSTLGIYLGFTPPEMGRAILGASKMSRDD